MVNLKNVLILNAVTSMLTGILLVVILDPIASLFSVPNTLPFTAAGVFLIVYSLFVLYTSKQLKNNFKLVNWVIALDILWVVKSIIVVLLFSKTISILGTVLILAVAAWVSLMAFLQYKTKASNTVGIN